jgi:Kef-type K+ transport system membrane component KefB
MLTTVSAALEGVDLGRVLLDLAIILLVAKIASEISDRIRVPAVIGEIAAGIVIGPSVLGLVSASDLLFVLAEFGVIFLLIQVGLETDVAELRSVGRASMAVATIGVVLPMALGIGVGLFIGESTNTSLFIGAALTATSIGITARVFGDLRALATVEARTVLGAAVVDDVLGLIILTVVTRIVEQGSVGLGTIATTIGLAVGFLILTSVIGFTTFPAIFSFINKQSRSTATLSVTAIGIALVFSVLADKAHLAPIIGAFVAGLALRRISANERVERDVASLGQIFIPVFFLYIGITTDIQAMFDVRVLAIALIFSTVAIIGKVAAAAGALGTNSDKLVIGFGMLPRGEVGLIFATIGLKVGALNEEMYGSILFVVLLTTLLAPPLLRWRLGKETVVVEDSENYERPATGWVDTTNGIIHLHGTPPVRLLVEIGLDTALLATDARPSPQLLDWFAMHRNATLSWENESVVRLLNVLRYGNARSWRFLDTIGLVQRALPELAQAMSSRASDSTELDPTHALHFPTVEAISSTASSTSIEGDELVLAAFAHDISVSGANGIAAIRRLGLDLTMMSNIELMVDGASLLRSIVSAEPLNINSRLLNQIATHLKTPRIVEQCRQLCIARSDFNDTSYLALVEVISEVQEFLAHPDLIDSTSNSILETKVNAALALTSNSSVRSRITHAPASYALVHSPEQMVQHAELVEPSPRAGQARVAVHATDKPDTWMINIACRDRTALLARLSSALSSLNLNVLGADITTWGDGAVLDIFTVQSISAPNRTDVTKAVIKALSGRRVKVSDIPFALHAVIDNSAHPWHSVLTITGPDRSGLLRDVTATLADLKVVIHHANISTENGIAKNTFEIADRLGRKLSSDAVSRVISALQ